MRRLVGFSALCCVLYILAAPPIVATTIRGAGKWPKLYMPLLEGMQYETSARFINWYFNDVWKCGFACLDPSLRCKDI